MAAMQLNGQKLMEVQVNPETGATRFVFDLGSILEAYRLDPEDDDELWWLYEPSGYVLSVRGDGTYDHEPGSGTDERPAVVRRPLPRS